mmetsp:Transcript_39323/g.111369  ORF Transcript_39323/g.111369 Transcript_39323/m.111369 type:complete len:1062 (-) Transcript_39323:1170-4355(-)
MYGCGRPMGTEFVTISHGIFWQTRAKTKPVVHAARSKFANFRNGLSACRFFEHRPACRHRLREHTDVHAVLSCQLAAGVGLMTRFIVLLLLVGARVHGLPSESTLPSGPEDLTMDLASEESAIPNLGSPSSRFLLRSERPRAKPFLGHRELLRQPNSWRHGPKEKRAFDFHHVDGAGRATSLSYTAIHNHNEEYILRLDMPDDDPLYHYLSGKVVQLECSPAQGKLYLRCEDESSAEKLAALLVKGSLLAAGPHWGCIDQETGRPTILLERVVTNATVHPADPVWLEFTTEAAGHAAFFKHLKFHFHTDRFPEDHFTEHVDMHETTSDDVNDAESDRMMDPDDPMLRSHAGSDAQAHIPGQQSRSLLGVGDWFGGLLGRTWKAVKRIVGEVDTLVETAATVMKVLILDGGNYHNKTKILGSSWAWNWDWNDSQPHTKELMLHNESNTVCLECFARAELGVTVEIHIEEFDVKMVEAYVQGEAAFHLRVQMARAMEHKQEKLLTTIESREIFTNVGGIPVVMKFIIPISFGHDLKAEMRVDVMAYWEASLKYGMHYDKETGLSNIAEQKFDPIGDFSSSLGASLTASATVYLLPAILLQLQYIGGPTIGLKPFIEFGLMASASFNRQDSHVQNSCDNGILLTLQAGVQATASAEIRVQFPGGKPLFQKSIPRKTVFSAKYPIHSGCIQLDSPSTEKALEYTSVTPSLWQGRPGGSHGRPRLQQTLNPITTNDGTLPGTTWSGTVVANKNSPHEECRMYRDGNLTLQVVDWTSVDNFILVGATNYVDGALREGTAQSCVVQSGFEGQLYRDSGMRSLMIKPISGGSEYDLSECTNGNPPLPYGWVGYADPEMKAMRAYDSMNCYKIELFREIPEDEGSGSPSTPCRKPEDAVPPDQIICEGVTNERSCLEVNGCGWCIDDEDYSSGCCPGTAVNPNLPCAPASNGYTALKNCNNGWQAGNSQDRFAALPECDARGSDGEPSDTPAPGTQHKCWVLDPDRRIDGEPVGWDDEHFRRMLLQGHDSFKIQYETKGSDQVRSCASCLKFQTLFRDFQGNRCQLSAVQ